MAFDPLPPLDRTSATFKTDLDTLFLTKLPLFSVQAEALRVEVVANAGEATAAASTATTQAGNAASSAGAAAESASTALAKAGEAIVSANSAVQAAIDAAALLDQFDDRYLGVKAADPTVDNDGNALVPGAIYVNSISGYLRAYTGSGWVQGISAISGVSSVNGLPGDVVVQPTLVSGTNIKSINGVSLLGSGDLPLGSSMLRSDRTSNTALGTADKGKLIDITSGTFSQTFDAVGTLGDGWYCYLRNSGTGDITLDPNASETIDGLTSFVMYPGECRLVQCDGVALRSVVLNAFYRKFTSSGTFTKPPGYNYFDGLLWGGGGAGAKDGASSAAGGGGGGNCLPFILPTSAFGASETVTIGAGGIHTATHGGDGGNSTVGSLFTSYGGGGGSSAGNGGGGGGSLSAGSSIGNGQPYTSGSNRENSGFGGAPPGYRSAYGGAGGSNAGGGFASLWGGASGGAGNATTAGGISTFGGNGGGGSQAGTASAGAAPGGGGGGTYTGTSGDGARGELRIRGVI